MKNYLTEWKKFKNKILSENIEATEIALQNSKAKLEGAKKQKEVAELNLKLAQQEVAANENAISQQKKIETTQQSSSKSAPATTGTTGTTGPKMEENVAGTRDEGTMGKQPVSVAENEELTEEELEEASGEHEGVEEGGGSCMVELSYDEMEEEKTCNECKYCRTDRLITEAKYKGRTVPLGKPMRGDVKKFKVFVRDPKTGNVKKVNFGDKKMRIKKSNPKRRKSFRARHRCANPGPRTKARYWSCRKW